jgi:uncharacterized repeat protein (TIGR01451 family)
MSSHRFPQWLRSDWLVLVLVVCVFGFAGWRVSASEAPKSWSGSLYARLKSWAPPINTPGWASSPTSVLSRVFVAPEIAVEQPVGTDLPDGGSKDFGTVATNQPRELDFTIRNTGDANLTGFATSIDGTDAARFSVVTAATSPVAGGSSTTFTVRFTPGTTGAKTAALHITNNDSDENLFDINLTGTGGATTVIEVPAAYNLGSTFPGTPVAYYWQSPGTARSISSLIANIGSVPATRTWTPSSFVTNYVNNSEGLFALLPGNDSNTVVPHTNVIPISGSRFALRSYLSVATSMDTNAGLPGIQFNATLSSDDQSILVLGGGPNADPAVGMIVMSTLLGSTGATLSFPSAGYYQFDGLWQEDAGGTTFQFRTPPGATVTNTPEIAVEQPVNTGIADGGTNLFGTVSGGSNEVQTFTIRNTGAADLTGLAITKNGAQAAEFTVSSLGTTTLTAGSTTTFTVTFAPTAGGTRTAAIHIASNDADENPFDITLTGTGSAIYTFTGTGNWTDTARWSPSYPGLTIASTDTAIIASGAVCAIPASTTVTINGVLTVNGSINKDTGTSALTNNASGSISIAAGGAINNNSGNLTNAGMLTAAASSTFTNGSGIFTNSGAFNNATTFHTQYGSFSNSGTVINTGTLTGSQYASISNTGSWTNSAGGSMTMNGLSNSATGTITNNGTMNVGLFNSGTVVNNATINGNYFGITNNAGAAWTNSTGSTMHIGAQTWTNSGTWNENGSFSMSEQSGLSSINNTATGVLNIGGSFTLNGGVPGANSGTINVNSGGSLALNGSHATFTNNGTIANSGTVTNASVFKGTGSHTGNVFTNNSGGTVAPGGTTGCHSFSSYTNAGTLAIEIGGAAPCTQHDQLQASGTATLGGTLTVTTFGGYTPGTTTSYTILTAATVSGTFATINYPTVCGIAWSIAYNATNVVVTATVSAQPEINVQGGSPLVTIADGDPSPSATDDTDFGSVSTAGGTIQRTFTIQNTGAAALTVTGINKSGTHQADFTIGALTPASPIPASSSATFTVTFDPSATGLRTATINIANSDCDEAAYDFAVQGTGANTAPTVASDAGSKLFIGRVVANPASVARVNTDGTGLTLSVVSSTVPVYGVAVDSVRGKVYFTSHTGDRLSRANLDGTGLEANFITVATGAGATGLAIDLVNGHLYWAQAYAPNGGGIMRANLDGTGVTQILSGFNVYDIALNVAGNKIYYAGDFSFSIGRCDLNGANNNRNWLANMGGVSGVVNGMSGLAVDLTNGKLYWSRSNGIGQANLDGSSIVNPFITLTNGSVDVVADPITSKLFWTRSGGTVGCANLDGTNVNESLVTGLTGTWGIDLASTDFEGSVATRTGTYSDPDGDTVTITANIGSVTKTGTSSGTWTWTYTPPDGPTTVNVTITATDSNNAASTTSFVDTVLNVAPTIALTGNATVDVNTSYTLNLGTITDPGTDTVTAYSINWGDGVTEPFSGNPANTSKTHSYTAGGSKMITVSLTDEDGTFTGGTKTITVNMPVLAVSKSQPSPSLTTNQNSTYTITVTNSGSAPATAATVKDAIPAGMKLISASGTSWTCTPFSGNPNVGTITCTFAGAIAATNGTSTLSVVVCPTAGGSVTNKVSVDPTSGMSAPDPTTCTALNTPSAGCGAPVTSGANTPPTVASDAGSKLFVGRFGQNAIARANIDGTGVIPNAVNSSGTVLGFALDQTRGKIYWTDFTANGHIGRANMDGTGLEPNFISGAVFPNEIAVDSATGQIYWSQATGGNAATNGVWRANADGTGVTQFLTITGGDYGIDVAGGKLYYFPNDGTRNLSRINLDGTGSVPNFLPAVGGGSGTSGLAVDSVNQKIYFGTNTGSTIGCANLDGTGINLNFTTTGGAGNDPAELAVDGTGGYLYYTAYRTGNIGRVALNGSNNNTAFITSLTGTGVVINYGLDIGSADFEAAQATRTGTYSDPDGNTVTITADIGSVTKTGTSSGTWTWTYTPPDGPATVNVTITATDINSAASTTTFTVGVLNIAPTIALTGNAAVDVNTSYTLNLGAITDPGTDTVTSYSINWGDGTTEPFSGNPSNTSKTHTYTTGGSKTITVSLTDEDGTFTGGTKTITVNAPVLAVSKSQPSPGLVVGQNSTYTITVTNSGGAAATAATVKDAIPAGMKLISVSGSGWTCTPSSGNPNVGTITCTFAGTLAATNGSSTLSVVVCPTAPGSVTNHVSVDPVSSTNAPDPTTCTALNAPTAGCGAPVTSTVTGVPQLAVSKSQPSPSLVVGQNSTYTITVTNSGSLAATTATVKEAIPAGMKLISATGTGWTCTPSSGNPNVGTITCSFSGSIVATNGTSTISVVVCPTVSGSVTNYVSVDPTSGTNAPDPTTCTALNTPTAGCGAPVTSNGSALGAALDFDGANDYVSVPSTPALHPTNAIAMEAWVKPTGGGNFARIADSSEAILLSKWGGSNTFTFVLVVKGAQKAIISPTPWVAGNWYHVAGTYDGSAVRLFVNGVLIDSVAATGPITTSNNALLIGLGHDPYYFQGQMDELRLWNRALCQDEIQAHMNCELMTTETGLAAYYKFNQGLAGGSNTGINTLTDSGPNGFTGTLNNFALSGATSNWATPGSVTTGTTCAVFLAPEIDVRGNGNPIADGSPTPSPTNDTDFGSANVAGGTVTHTLTIANTGTRQLLLSGMPKVAISGTHASDFTVTVQPTSPVAVTNGTTTFTIVFDPSGIGTRTATVTIENDDCDEGPYSFVIQGTGANLPPTITAGITVTRQQGTAGSTATIAMVSDDLTAAGSVVVTTTTVPTGISITGVSNSGGTISATVAALCNAALGDNTVVLTATDGNGGMATANFIVTVTANTAPTVGTYGNTGVAVGGNVTITPNASPADNGSITSVTATASPNTFTGTFSGNTTTGALTITNAGPSGTYTITVTVTDNCGATVQQSFTLTVNTAPTINAVANSRQQGSPVSNSTIATVSDVDQAAGSLTVKVNGNGTATVNGVTVSNLANSNGTITADVVASCTATNASFTLTVTDGSNAMNTATLNVTVTANAAPTLSYANQAAAAGGSLNVSPATASDNGSIASFALLSQGGYTGTLSVNPTTGVVMLINIKPTGGHTITIRATDNCGLTADASFMLNVSCAAITVTAPATNNGTANAAFSQQFTQSGGVGTTTFSTASALPSGLTLSAGGVLAGMPTQTGTFPLSVVATDSNGCTGQAGYTLMINCQTITVEPVSIASGNPGVPYSQQFTQSNGIGTIAFTTSSTLPTGITLSTSGLLAGTTAQTGSFPITIKATDANGCMGTASYTLAFGCPTITVTPPAVTTGTAGAAFSQTFTQSGGTAGTAFSTGGPLPNGLTLSSGGVLGGTPTQTGTFPITVTATSSGGCTGMASYTLTISCPTITVTPPAVATGTASMAFSQSFTQSGAVGSATFSVASGSLPPGLTLATNGTLSGTPAQAGTFSFTVKVTDANNCTGTSAGYSLVIGCPAITLNPTSTTPPTDLSGQAGVAYSQTITATPNGTSYTFEVTTGALPAGLTLNANTGVISGTTNLVGTFTFTITATGWGNCTGSRQYRLTTTCPAITLSSLAAGTAGTAYNQTLTASPSGGGYSFAVTTGTLPPGLSLNASTGAVTGTPSTAGTFSFTVTATGFGNCTGLQSYSVVIACPAVTLSPTALPNATVNTAYSQTVGATPAGTAYSFSVTTGTLPSGLSLNSSTGAITGAPTQSGTFNFRVTATGWGACTGFRDYTLMVGCPAITLDQTTLPNGAAGAAYSQTLSATPAGAYSFSLTQGGLPGGLTVGNGGVISGTPTASGTFTFTVTATAGGCSGSRGYTIVIACDAGITINPATLPAGQAGSTYSQQLTVTPAGTYTFALAQGNLPSGLTLNTTTGLISGMPLVVGTASFVVKVTNGSGCQATRNYTLAINCPTTITVSPASLPNGTVGTAYSQAFSAAPAGGGYSFTQTGTLPPGLTFNTATGSLSGTPTANGTFSFTITATGFGGCSSAPKSYSITIGAGCNITLPASLPAGNVGNLYNQMVTASPAGNYTYSLSGTLPPGLTFYSASALLFGYPNTQSSYTFTITASVTGNSSCSASQSYTVAIGAAAFAKTGDFDGDGKADLSVWRGMQSDWLIVRSSDDQVQNVPWGAEYAPYNDVIVPADYDGDGKVDVAVFRRGDGRWYIKRSSDGETTVKHWGLGTDVPVAGDYDGDGKADIAVWRGAEGRWYVVRSSDGQTQIEFWGASYAPYSDVPVPADYDGDGKTDIAVFRTSTGHWYVKRSSDGVVVDKYWGLGTDVPVPADYDGDGQTDIAVWRGSEGIWYIVRSIDDVTQTISLGAAWQGDVPVPGDYDGDGKADAAIWREATGTWQVRQSGNQKIRLQTQGQAGDKPVMARQP